MDVPTRGKWPRMNDTSAWKAFKDTIGEILEATFACTKNRNLKSFTTTLYTVDKCTFCTKEMKVKSPVIPATTDVMVKSAISDAIYLLAHM